MKEGLGHGLHPRLDYGDGLISRNARVTLCPLQIEVRRDRQISFIIFLDRGSRMKKIVCIVQYGVLGTYL